MEIATGLAPGLGTGIGVSAIVVIVVLTLAFVVGKIRHRYRDIDVFWPLGFVAVAVSGFVMSSSATGSDTLQRVLLLVVVSLWGVRLAAHLGWRSRGEEEDPRYVALMRGAKGRNETLYAIVVIYALQAALMFFVSLSITVGMYATSPLRLLEIVGLVIWFVGFGFEAIGDFQLSRFLANPANRGHVMDQGLWSWTRHPNYFGDAALWWGIFFIASAGLWGFATVLSPLVMNRLLTSVSGKPLLEGRMKKTREGYAEYLEKTSPFFPRPPRKTS
jgi:steroid 5-alpha reductase family enzyme